MRSNMNPIHRLFYLAFAAALLTLCSPLITTPVRGAESANDKKHIDLPASHPVVPGSVHTKAGSAQQGELLIGALSCTSCHKADAATAARLHVKQPPLLGDIASRMTPQYLREYLKAPHTLKSGTTMPDVFHASTPQARDGAVEYITHFLMSQSKPMAKSGVAADPGLINRGKELYHTTGCVACHSPQAPASEFNKEFAGEDDPFADDKDVKKKAGLPKNPSVPLGNALGSRMTVEALAKFLSDPLKTRPSGRMPNLGLSDEDATAIAAYLLREQATSGSIDESRVAGVMYEYYEGSFGGDEPIWSKHKANVKDKLDRFHLRFKRRGQNFAVRYRGSIDVPKDGEYTFFTKSDDGSWLYIDGKKIVDNGGIHGEVEKSGKVKLSKGAHSIYVGFTQGGGGEALAVGWSGPGMRKQIIDGKYLTYSGKAMQPIGEEKFVVEPQKAQFGARMFTMLRCAQCHQMKASDPPVPAFKPIPSLAAIDSSNDASCIGNNTRKGLPKYGLSKDQKSSILAALKAVKLGDLAKALSPKEKVNHQLTALNCYACHNRNGLGGPEPAREGYFRINGDGELGDEGRIPPTLTAVGGKLKKEALHGLLTTSQWRVRTDYMATRMPQFGSANVGNLTDDLIAEASASKTVEATPAVNHKMIKTGKQLVGTSTKTKGFACVNCHNVAGKKSLGVPAVDMATMYTRLRKDWFDRFLRDPGSINKKTRMPVFWPDGKSPFKDVLAGDTQKQIDAIWTYLSLGKSMPLPPGMQSLVQGNEITPGDAPVIFRTFMTDTSPRAIAVGNPELLHFAFDGNVIRLAKAWRGKFFDPSGTWNGRAGQFKGPLGTDIINLPPGPSFTLAGQPFPKAAKTDRNVGGRFKGYKLDDEHRPIFTYGFSGYMIEEQPVPTLKAGGAVLVRKFKLTPTGPIKPLKFRAGFGSKIEKLSDDTWMVDDKIKVTIPASQKLTASIGDADGGKELVLTLPTKGEVIFELTMSW
jgi:mono/diheme cytochrome c family protein